MSPGPLVSVVIPFFNAGPFIEDAIAGVFAQTYPHWELLLVDDGSTDVSPQIGRRYAAQCPGRVRYVEQADRANRGLPVAQNLGLRHAMGELVAPLHADDVWLPGKLAQQTAMLQAHPDAGVVYGASQYWFGWTGQPADTERDHVPDLGIPPGTVVRPPRLLAWCLSGRARMPCASDVMLRRDLLERVGGFAEAFVGDRQAYEGQAVLAKASLEAPVIVGGECWDRYRQHRGSLRSRLAKTGGLQPVRRFYLEWLQRHLFDRGITDPEVWRALRRQLGPFRHPRMLAVADGLRDPLKPARRLLGRVARVTRRFAGGDRVAAIEEPFGRLRRLDPIDRGYGWSRGLPIDRYYIEGFLERRAGDIRGRVLEIGDSTYTRKYGGGRVEVSDVLHAAAGNPKATFVADLTSAGTVPNGAFDCVILTQTLPFIYDVRAAVQELYRILKPGGVVLATVPGISPIIRKDMAAWGDYWRFTSLSARRLFEHVFPIGGVEVEAHGNVMTAVAFLHGLASRELSQHELDHGDPDYEVLITIRAVKPVSGLEGDPHSLEGASLTAP